MPLSNRLDGSIIARVGSIAQPGNRRNPSQAQVAAAVAVAVVVVAILAGAWWLPRVLSQPTPLPPTVVLPTATLTSTLTPMPSTTPSPTPPPLLHPAITALNADVDDQAGVITFHLQADVPPDRQVAEALLWYDTQVGRRLQRTSGPLPPTISLSYPLDVAQEGLTRTLTTTPELDYWWLVRDTAGESVRAGGTAILGPSLQARATSASAEPPAVDFTWAVSNTRHFQLYYAPGDAAERDLSKLGRLAEASFAHIRDVLQVDLDGTMSIYFVPRVFWQGGATYGNKVQLISYLDRNYTGVETWSYFTHEGTHALAQDLIQPKEGNEGGPDGVLVEGLAVWASDGHYRREPIDAWAAVVADSPSYIPLSQLRAGPFYDFQHETSYLEAGSFVKFLVDNYGLDKLKQLYGRATGKAEQDEELVQGLYGKGYADLEADWLSYLRGLSPTPEQAEAWRLKVRSFDLMRRYETELDPDARILPDKSPPDWTPDMFRIFLQRKQASRNLLLETALIAAEQRLNGDDPSGAGFSGQGLSDAFALLDEVEASLDARPASLPPSLQARQSILDLLAAQDRAVLLADAPAYLSAFGVESVPADVQAFLQLPFTSYGQELVRLDLSGDGQAAQALVLLHARTADGPYADDNRLFVVDLVKSRSRWLITGRAPAEPDLSPPAAWQSMQGTILHPQHACLARTRAGWASSYTSRIRSAIAGHP